MMNVFAKWGFTNDYGYANEENAKIEWFETEEKANEWKEKMKKGNGGYFKLWTIKKGNYEEYKRMKELEKELEELKKKF